MKEEPEPFPVAAVATGITAGVIAAAAVTTFVVRLRRYWRTASAPSIRGFLCK